MTTENKQTEQLPVTTSSAITEQKGTFAGLDGMSFFMVVIVAMLLMAFVHFFVGLFGGCVMYFIMRTYIKNRPDGFLSDMLAYPGRPKLFEHRPRGKRLFIKKDV